MISPVYRMGSISQLGQPRFIMDTIFIRLRYALLPGQRFQRSLSLGRADLRFDDFQ